LRYKYGKRNIKWERYKEAAQKWWLLFLEMENNEANVYLGENSPTKEMKAFLINYAEEKIDEAKAYNLAAFRKSKRANNIADAEKYRDEYLRILKNKPEWMKGLKKRFDSPSGAGHSEFSLDAITKDEETSSATTKVSESRGTTFWGIVIQMRNFHGSSSEEYRHNVRLHEFLHLFYLPDFEEDDVGHVDSIMIYPFINRNKNKKLSPQPFDIEHLYQLTK
jgi:hypothetical protein